MALTKDSVILLDSLVNILKLLILGPIWLPLVGCYPYLKKLHLKKKYLHLAGSVLHEIYGPVVGLKLGFDKVVLVSGYEGFKEVCGNECFDGRPDGLFFRLRSFGERLGWFSQIC